SVSRPRYLSGASARPPWSRSFASICLIRLCDRRRIRARWRPHGPVKPRFLRIELISEDFAARARNGLQAQPVGNRACDSGFRTESKVFTIRRIGGGLGKMQLSSAWQIVRENWRIVRENWRTAREKL